MPTVQYTTLNGQIISERQGGTRNFYGADPLGSTATIHDSSGNIHRYVHTLALWGDSSVERFPQYSLQVLLHTGLLRRSNAQCT